MKGIVAAGDAVTAEAGAKILREGGNAFDAVLAAMMTAPHSEPMLSSLGGGGFLLAAEAGEEPVLYDFFVDVPPNRVDIPDFFPIYVDFGNTVQEFHIGAGSTAVPGMIAGIESIYEELCSLPMQRIVAPAVEAASKGVVLSSMQAGFVKLLEPILLSTQESAAIYAPDGRLVDDKSAFVNREYADFLLRFAEEGASCFYSSDISEAIGNYYASNDGLLRAEDLKNYSVQKRKPVSLNYRSCDIYTNPPPSAGGVLIAFTLKMLSEGSATSTDSFEYVRELIESFAITEEFRRTHIDPHIHDEYAEKIMDDESLISHYLMSVGSRVNLWGNTTHISVMDECGNCASATMTNGEGSGMIAPGTGIMMNNMLGEEDLNPHGFFAWKSGVRLPSMMAPTIAMREGEPILILGSAGSNRIRSAITEVLDRYIRFSEAVKEAVEAPRIHYEKGKLFFEPGYDDSILRRVAQRYPDMTVFDEKSLFFGGVNAVTGDFQGAADSRRGAAVSIV
jgi:gamma-glutamyltranspeptidase/glutathione hydrolase